MLSEREKREMLEDARSKTRRDDFSAASGKFVNISFDEYLAALDDLQKVFSPFKTPTNITPTRLNKL